MLLIARQGFSLGLTLNVLVTNVLRGHAVLFFSEFIRQCILFAWRRDWNHTDSVRFPASHEKARTVPCGLPSESNVTY